MWVKLTKIQKRKEKFKEKYKERQSGRRKRVENVLIYTAWYGTDSWVVWGKAVSNKTVCTLWEVPSYWITEMRCLIYGIEAIYKINILG